MTRILMYAHRQGYTRYTSTLEEAWRISIQGLTAAIAASYDQAETLAEFGPNEAFSDDPVCAFAVEEASRHRARGIELRMFLGLFKYYRQAYLDRIEDARMEAPEPARLQALVTRLFDRMEIAFCGAWADLRAADHLTELENANRFMTNEKNRFLTVVESLAGPVLLLDAEARITYLNQAASMLLGSADRPGSSYYHPEAPKPPIPGWLVPLVTRCRDSKQEVSSEHVQDTPTLQVIEAHLRPMLDVSDKFEGTVIALRDITTLRTVEARLAENARELEKLSYTDSLTGLLNRRGLALTATPLLEQARRTEHPLHLLFSDVDNLKWINDHHGHLAGDAALVALGQAMRRSVRASDVIARVGGDEFVVVLPDSSEATRHLVVDRLAEHLNDELGRMKAPRAVTVSTGWARFDPARHTTLDALLSEADAAMYKRKRDGVPGVRADSSHARPRVPKQGGASR